jgi:hypothetical protein
VGQAGGVLLVEALRSSGLDQGLSAGLARWRKPTATHDPAKIICDLAVSLAVGGDCLADVGVLRSEPGVYGRVASDATVSARSRRWPLTCRRCWPQSMLPERTLAAACGSWPANTPPIITLTPAGR